ncbi:MAG: hypothetical protein GDA38_22165 [Hormoscilla sp. SP12CHS1]|nr:hypothetical protein [Hormoscilla sp. SP12CHS1]
MYSIFIGRNLSYIVKFIGHLLDKLHRDRGFADTSHAQNGHQATAFL